MEDKSFWGKTKVKVALAHALAIFIATFVQAMLEANNIGLSEEVFMMVLGALTTVALTVLGVHGITDTVATKKKIEMTGTLSKQAIIKEVATAVMKDRMSDEDPS